VAVGRVHVDEVLRERPEGRANHLEEMLVALVLAGGGELVTVERRATACHVGGQPPPLQRRQEAAGGGVHSVVGVAEGEMMDAVGEVGGLDVEALLLPVDAQQEQPRHALHHDLARDEAHVRARVARVGVRVGVWVWVWVGVWVGFGLGLGLGLGLGWVWAWVWVWVWVWVWGSHDLAGDKATVLREVRVVRAHVQRRLRRKHALCRYPTPVHLVLDLVLEPVAHVARDPAGRVVRVRVGRQVSGLGLGVRVRVPG
jgi:hypothetical protein